MVKDDYVYFFLLYIEGNITAVFPVKIAKAYILSRDTEESHADSNGQTNPT